MKKSLFFVFFVLILLVPIFSIQINDKITDKTKDKQIQKDKLKVNFDLISDDISVNSLNKVSKISNEKNETNELNSSNESTLTYDTLTDDTLIYEKYIIQFEDKVNKKWISDLEKEEVVFYDYIPDNSYLVQINLKNFDEIKNKDYILGIVKYRAEYKGLSKYISNNGNLVRNKKTSSDFDNFIEVDLTLYDNSNLEKVITQIQELGGEVRRNDVQTLLNKNSNKLRVKINTYKILELNSIVDVKTSEEFIMPKTFNRLSRTIMNVTTIWDDNNYNLFGSGQIITVADTGLDVGAINSSMHNDFQGRINLIQNFIDTYVTNDGASDLDSGHGTHVAGSVLGNGNNSQSDPNFNNFSNSFAGTAPKANLIFQAIEQLCDNATYCGGFLGDYLLVGIPEDLGDLFSPAYNNGSRIHTNSWGSECNGIYNDNSVEVDNYSWNNKDMSILFAAGNDGPGSDTMGCPATAKNTITVGATQYANTIASFSSRGPTDDGRIKPDVVAPGYNIISARSSLASGTLWGVYDSYYLYSNGTSMATPLVAGMSALIREHIQNNLSYNTPSSALIKSFIINGARDMTPNDGVLYDYTYGWGMVNLKNSIIENSSYGIDYVDNTTGINTNEYSSFNISIPNDLNNTQIPLKITLVWNDYPRTSVNVSVDLVNDLDLTLTLPNGTMYVGNNFNFSGNYDRLNNVEVVYVQNPIPSGSYKINVSGYNIVQGPQPFAIVYSYPLSEVVNLSLTSPIQNANYNNIHPSFNLIGNFSKNITSLIYRINSDIMDISNATNITNLLINNTLINTTINLTNEGEIDLILNYTDINGIKDSKLVSFNVSILNPIVTFTNPLNSSYVNVTNLEINLTANFSKNIKYLTYKISNIEFNLTSEIVNNTINTSIEILNYNLNNIEFNFTDYYNKLNLYNLIFNATLVFSGATLNDTDGDGINDTNDTLKGTSSNVKTTFNNLSIRVNDDLNISKNFNNLSNVSFYVGSSKLIEFENNFSENSVDLSNVTLKNSSESNKSQVLIRGLNLGSGKTKTIYLNLIGNTSRDKSVCIKDKLIYDFSEISSTCTGVNETYLNAIPSSLNGYSISYDENSSTKVKISGLVHSAISQVCSENWSYSNWGSCSGSSQSRSATDSNSCGTTNNRSSLTQSCSNPSGGGGSGGSSSGSSNSDSDSDSNSDSDFDSNSEVQNVTKTYNYIRVNENLNRNNVYINGVSLSSNNNFTGLNKIIIKNSENFELVSFDFNFSKDVLDLNNFKIEEGDRDDEENELLQNYIIVKGVPNEINKTVKLKISKERKSICIKDDIVNSISQISLTCNSNNEYLITCDDTLQFNKYKCIVGNGYYSISGLSHSAIVEFGNLKGIENNENSIDTIPNQNEIDNLENREVPILFDEVLNDDNINNENSDYNDINQSLINESSSNSILEKIQGISIYYIIYGCIFLVAIIFILYNLIFNLFLRNRDSSHLNEEEYQLIFNHIKNYLREHKNNYKKRDLVANLYEEKYPKDIIKKAIKDVYSKKDN